MAEPSLWRRLLSRIQPRVRSEDEFPRKITTITSPPHKQGPLSWSLEQIRTARDAQMLGNFQLPVRLAEAMRTDDACFNAYHTRLRAMSAIEARLVGVDGARGQAVKRKAEASVFVPKSTLKGIYGTLANHGVAIGYVLREPNEDGTRVNMRLTEWPLEYVRYRSYERVLVTHTLEGLVVPINHGDGEWIVFRKFHDRPWLQEACILPGCLVWAAHANGIANWAAASKSHGQAKIIGELPEGLALAGKDGTLEPEALAFLQMIQDLVSGEGGAGIRPYGSKTDFLANGSTAWQVFDALIQNREKAAMRIYLGTDASLGSLGGAPGVDISELFGISSTTIQDDLQAVEQALRTGLYEPWCAINEGTSQYAPALVFQVPDPDAAEKEEQARKARSDLLALLKEYTAQGYEVTQDVVDKLAAELGVKDPPCIPAVATRIPAVTLAPADQAKIVRVREARMAAGFEPFGDERDDMTVAQLDQQAEIEVARIKAGATVQAAATAPPPPPPQAAP